MNDQEPVLAEALGIPPETWANFEAGVKMPAEVVLGLLVLTGVRPEWLLTGRWRRFNRRYHRGDDLDERPPVP